jgi:3-oxoacyl-[acyl-carrier-protein] synthase II
MGVPAFWDGLIAGRSAVRAIARFDATDLSPSMAAEVTAVADDDPDRAGMFALLAADEALQAAGLRSANVEPTRLGVSLGTTLGGMQIFEAWNAGGRPSDLPRVPYYGPAVRLAQTVRAAGPVVTAQLACASGTQAIAIAAAWVRSGLADVVLAGGTDVLCRFVVAGFNCLRATAAAARPFDRAREGLVLGEGAGLVVVESEAHARARGATIRAVVLGAGAAGDAVHMTAPDREGRGAARAMQAALHAADRTRGDVDYVSAHGTGTVYNDAMEAAALGRLFDAGSVPVNSIKGAIGHTLGAAGALEAVVCVQALATGEIPPTAGLADPDPVCADLDLVRGVARRRAVDVALSTSSGFAGANAALVFGRA